MLSYDVIQIESANPIEADKSYDILRRRAVNIFIEKHPRVTPISVVEQRGHKENKPNEDNPATWWTAKVFTLLVYYNDPDWVMPSNTKKQKPTAADTIEESSSDQKEEHAVEESTPKKKRGRPKKY